MLDLRGKGLLTAKQVAREIRIHRGLGGLEAYSPGALDPRPVVVLIDDKQKQWLDLESGCRRDKQPH